MSHQHVARMNTDNGTLMDSKQSTLRKRALLALGIGLVVLLVVFHPTIKVKIRMEGHHHTQLLFCIGLTNKREPMSKPYLEIKDGGRLI